MTISMDEARAIVLKNLPEGTEIMGSTQRGGLYLFLAPFPDPLEGNLDPFFSVDTQTGYFRDFSPLDYPDSSEIITQLLATT